MPLYDFKCLNCNEEFEQFARIKDRNKVKCWCDGETEILITNSKNDDWFKPHFNEHFTGEPVFVKSRRHMKELCLKHDVTSRALGDFRDYTHRKTTEQLVDPNY